jgi:hypothetical protein
VISCAKQAQLSVPLSLSCPHLIEHVQVLVQILHRGGGEKVVFVHCRRRALLLGGTLPEKIEKSKQENVNITEVISECRQIQKYSNI